VFPEKKIYFASDFHFGVPDHASSLKRERFFIEWLDIVKNDASEIFLMGDLFDFWFEYKTVIPKGFVRLLGKLAELTDAGIQVHLFRGNHDVWAFDYLNKELGIQLHRAPVVRVFNERKFFLAHGDGLGPGDHGYKFLKKVFESPLNQWLFRWLHPDIGTRMGLYFSRRSRISNNAKEGKLEKTLNIEGERLYQFCNEYLASHPGINYFLLGHRHLPYDTNINESSRFINLGDWITHFSYAEFDGKDLNLKFFKPY
jgi:UDP-2,3-diacylglucosamine hydrolase